MATAEARTFWKTWARRAIPATRPARGKCASDGSPVNAHRCIQCATDDTCATKFGGVRLRALCGRGPRDPLRRRPSSNPHLKHSSFKTCQRRDRADAAMEYLNTLPLPPLSGLGRSDEGGIVTGAHGERRDHRHHLGDRGILLSSRKAKRVRDCSSNLLEKKQPKTKQILFCPGSYKKRESFSMQNLKSQILAWEQKNGAKNILLRRKFNALLGGESDSESDDDDDYFSQMTRKKKRRKTSETSASSSSASLPRRQLRSRLPKRIYGN